jgi:uncharacterized tellurite resistance protein B-like protein
LTLMLSLAACVAPRSPVPSTYPLFVPEPHDAPVYRALAQEQDSRLSICAKSHSCDRAHFARALIALYENQQLAASHFQQVVDAAPDSRMAASSLVWLHVIRDGLPPGGRSSALAQAAQQLILDYLEAEAASVQALQQEIKARDKKVEDLTKQIEALKRVDQEMKEKTRPKKQSNRDRQPMDQSQQH